MMRRFLAVTVGFLCVIGLGCASASLNPLFGPYPSSTLGNIAAGVAGFVPGVVPGEGQFALILFNADSENAHTVRVTDADGTPTTVEVDACGTENVLVTCGTAIILVELLDEEGTTVSTFEVTPPATCQTALVYIDPGAAGDGEEEATATLTDTTPEAAADCTDTVQ